MIRIAIVEDSATERTRLKDYVENYFSGKGCEIELFVFEDGKYLLERYPTPLDLILLDIEMACVDGLKTAHAIRAFDQKVQILFVTHMIQYALEGYAVDAADFIVKPIRYPVFCTRLDHVMKKIQASRPRFLVVRQGREQISCPVQQILFIESRNKKTILHRKDGEPLQISDPLYLMEKQLESEAFFRCHNAFLVNLDEIRTVSTTEVTVGNLQIPVSKYRKKEFMQSLANYRGKML